MALKSLVSNLVSDGQHGHDGQSTCLADGHHGHAYGPMASSFTAFFPDAVAPHHSDHLPAIHRARGRCTKVTQLTWTSSIPVIAGVASRRTRRPKTYVSFHKEEGEEKKEGE